jgi:hypothetical protein
VRKQIAWKQSDDVQFGTRLENLSQ